MHSLYFVVQNDPSRTLKGTHTAIEQEHFSSTDRTDFHRFSVAVRILHLCISV